VERRKPGVAAQGPTLMPELEEQQAYGEREGGE
jgi:hypothetical protein